MQELHSRLIEAEQEGAILEANLAETSSRLQEDVVYTQQSRRRRHPVALTEYPGLEDVDPSNAVLMETDTTAQDPPHIRKYLDVIRRHSNH